MRLRIEPAFMRRLFHGSTNHQRNPKKRRAPVRGPGQASPVRRTEATDMVTIMSPQEARYNKNIQANPTPIAPPRDPFSPTPIPRVLSPLAPGHNPSAPVHNLPFEPNFRPPSFHPPSFHPPAHFRRLEGYMPGLQYEEEGRDRIVKPSKGSGGVPFPSQQYIDLASQPPLLLPQPRNLLVAIDLNGTLLHRPNPYKPTNFIKRPYAQSFLSYCIQTFTVVIWSSARPHNVEIMCNQLMTPEERDRVVAIWGRDTFGLADKDYFKRVMCYKRLELLWEDPAIAASHPRAGLGEKWSQLNTVLVDDTTEKGQKQPFNLICVPPFDVNAPDTEPVLPQVHDYLNACSQQFNVSAFMRSQPFALKPGFTL